jgi:hypothetical protein
MNTGLTDCADLGPQRFRSERSARSAGWRPASQSREAYGPGNQWSPAFPYRAATVGAELPQLAVDGYGLAQAAANGQCA